MRVIHLTNGKLENQRFFSEAVSTNLLKTVDIKFRTEWPVRFKKLGKDNFRGKSKEKIYFFVFDVYSN